MKHGIRLGKQLATALLLAWTCAAAGLSQQKAPNDLNQERLMSAMHSISSHDLLDYVKELASDKYRGRLTGTPGYDAAAEWTIRLLSGWNVRPAGDQGSWLQKFPNPYTLVLPGAELSLRLPIGNGGSVRKNYLFEQEFFPGSTSDTGTVTAEVIYAGYGITAPELGFDEYQGLNVEEKLVLIEPESPVGPDADASEFRKWRPYSFHDYKIKNAAEHGAAGVVYNYHIVNPNCIFVKGLVLTYVSTAVTSDLFEGTGKNHEEVVRAIRNSRKPASFPLGKTMTAKSMTEHHPEGIGSNVIGMIEGTDPLLKSEYIIVGGHLDHLGLNDQLMPGANDNASGVAVTLGVAEAIHSLARPLKRSVLFILFGAEEQGVKGSEYYVAHPVVPNERVKAFLNMESVGRGEQIAAGGGRNYPQLWETLNEQNQKYIHRLLRTDFSSNLARPRQDAAHFMWANIPTISFGTWGAKRLPYATYHTTKDSVDIVTPEIMQDLARLTFLAVVQMAEK